jgi:hypothetical protein
MYEPQGAGAGYHDPATTVTVGRRSNLLDFGLPRQPHDSSLNELPAPKHCREYVLAKSFSLRRPGIAAEIELDEGFRLRGRA